MMDDVRQGARRRVDEDQRELRRLVDDHQLDLDPGLCREGLDVPLRPGGPLRVALPAPEHDALARSSVVCALAGPIPAAIGAAMSAAAAQLRSRERSFAWTPWSGAYRRYAVFIECLLSWLESETRPMRDRHVAVFVGRHVLEENVHRLPGGEVELDKAAVGDRAVEMDIVIRPTPAVPDVEIERLRQACHPKRFGKAADVADIGLRNVDGAIDDQLPVVPDAADVLAGRDRDAGVLAQLGHRQGIIAPDRLLEPLDVVRLHQRDEMLGLRQREQAVRIEHEPDARTDFLSDQPDPFGVLLRLLPHRARTRCSAGSRVGGLPRHRDDHLQGLVTLLDHHAGDLHELLAAVFGHAEGHISRHRVVPAAQELADRNAVLLPLEVPQREVDRADAHAPDAAERPAIELLEQIAPDLLVAARIHADEGRSQLLIDELARRDRHAGRSREAVADEVVVRVDTRDHDGLDTWFVQQRKLRRYPVAVGRNRRDLHRSPLRFESRARRESV